MPSPDIAWKATLGELEMQMTRATFNTWLQGTRALACEGHEFVIGVRSDFAKDWLENRLNDLITRTLSGIVGHPTTARFVVWTDEVISSQRHLKNEEGRIEIVDKQPANSRSTEYSGALKERYTFSTFVVGPNNRLAHAAALSVAENPGKTYNPLFIYGGVGLGKTHLLHAIGHRCIEEGHNIRYISAETFTNDMVAAIRSKNTPDFRELYRTVDVLLIDDIQFMAGKEGTQDEFFHTFNELHSSGKQVVISSDRPPKALASLEERLLSRFAWGLTADVQMPDEETRRAILISKADEFSYDVPEFAIAYVAHEVRHNIRELEGALNKIVAYARLTGEPINQRLVELALVDTLQRTERVNVDAIIKCVGRYYNVPLEQLLSSSRKSGIAQPRQVAMYLARTETDTSLPKIGAFLGNRDHTTIMHGCDKISSLVETDAQLRRDVLQIKAMLYDRAAVVTA